MHILIKCLILSVVSVFWINTTAQSYETEFQTRAQQIVNYVADDYKADASGWYNCNPSDYGKYNWPIAVACFHKYGLTNAKANQYLPHFNTPTCIQARFHFNLAGETYIFSNYWGAPSVKTTVKSYLTAAWNRNDSYNLFTAEGTENHIAMTRPAAYLYAQIARDSFPADFPDAQQKLDSAKLWIMDWAKMLYTAGLGEWNSSTYAPYGMIGWIALYDGAKDPEVRKVAQAVLDYYACEMALHYTQGIVGGYESRNGSGYESVLSGGDYFSWLWFGDSPRKISWAVGTQNVEASTAVYAAVSGYRPPLAAVKLANKQLTKNAMYYNSKGEYLMNNPGAVKQTFFIGDTYTLGAAYLPYGGFTGGNTQFQAWKFVGRVKVNESTTAKTANVIVGYGSKEWNKARHRMPWDQLVHHRNVLVQLTKVPTNYNAIYTQIQTIINNWKTSWANDFKKRFPNDNKGNPVNMSADVSNANFSYMAVWKKNATVNRLLRNNIEFFEMDSNYVAIRSIAQVAPTYTSANDNYALKDAAPQGNLCGLILEVGSKKEYASFVAFQDAIITNSSLNKTNIATDNIVYTSANGDVLNIQYNSSGTFTEPIYDWGYGPVTQQFSQTSPPFIQPTWPSGEGFGRLASWSVNGNALDFENSKWSVYDGPNLQLKNSVLRLDDGVSMPYLIDYTGSLPIYSTDNYTKLDSNRTNNDAVKIYPNPATNILNVELISDFIGNYIVELVDLNGRSMVLRSNRKSAVKEIVVLPLPERLKGSFLLKVTTSQKLIVRVVQIN